MHLDLSFVIVQLHLFVVVDIDHCESLRSVEALEFVAEPFRLSAQHFIHLYVDELVYLLHSNVVYLLFIRFG